MIFAVDGDDAQGVRAPRAGHGFVHSARRRGRRAWRPRRAARPAGTGRPADGRCPCSRRSVASQHAGRRVRRVIVLLAGRDVADVAADPLSQRSAPSTTGSVGIAGDFLDDLLRIRRAVAAVGRSVAVPICIRPPRCRMWPRTPGRCRSSAGGRRSPCGGVASVLRRQSEQTLSSPSSRTVTGTSPLTTAIPQWLVLGDTDRPFVPGDRDICRGRRCSG